MMQAINYVLNRVTMYRLVLYYLLAIVAGAMLFGAFGILPYHPLDILFSLAFITGVSLLVNALCSNIFSAPANTESTYITALILALLITPVSVVNLQGILLLAAVSVIAIVSKYLLTLFKKPLFNPAALGLVVMAFLLGHSASWWAAGNTILFPIILIGGILVVQKLQRWDLVLPFFIAGFLSILVTTPSPTLALFEQVFVHSSLLFLGFIMLTEPITTPSTRMLRILYGVLVGILFAPAIHIGSIYSAPELALVIGNLIFAFTKPRKRILLTLADTEKTGSQSMDFVFASSMPFSYLPGQYMEWTLPHKNVDSRGNRRYFTLASSPTEKTIRLGVKFTSKGSSFKEGLLALKKGAQLSALEIGGNFTLPKNRQEKLVFIAGGIGITPFRSMLQFLLDTKEKRDVVAFYSNRMQEDIAYKEVLARAEQELGIKTHYIVTDEEEVPAHVHRTLTPEFIMQEVPDYKTRLFYISGPQGMITSFRDTLIALGVPKHRIKTDFFPGFA